PLPKPLEAPVMTMVLVMVRSSHIPKRVCPDIQQAAGRDGPPPGEKRLLNPDGARKCSATPIVRDAAALLQERDRAFGRLLHEVRVLRQHALLVARLRLDPLLEALPKLFLRDLQVDLALLDVDRDRVALADRSDRAANERLGRDVPDHQAARRTAESTIGHPRHRLPQPLTDDGGGDAEPSLHPA